MIRVMGYFKKIVQIAISRLNKIILEINSNFNDVYSGLFFLVRIKKEKGNPVNIVECKIKRTSVQIAGSGNSIALENCLIESSQIVITGHGNTLSISKDVKLRKADIIIKGNNCNIIIGKGTTFLGVRIVNVGNENDISIGENCLFSDHIEIWASDTHSIFNSQNERINRELPIRIGNNVWVGSRVIILKGTEIEEGAIIGMGTIVSKDVTRNSISVGVPNRVVKRGVRWTEEYL